jgi:signal transduction histidine kinase
MADYLSGLLTAWAAVQLALSAFFMLAYFLGRREAEYFIFSLLCCSLSLVSAGVAYDYAQSELPARLLADRVTHTGLILAAAVNLHFALSFARTLGLRLRAGLLYVVAAGYLFVLWSGGWVSEQPPQLVDAYLFGQQVVRVADEASWLGKSFYVVAALETAVAAAVLVSAYRAGQREVGSAILGILCILPAVGNDWALALGFIDNAVPLLPHAFLLYALGVAGTLLLRYRVGKDELEQAARSLEQKSEELRHSYAELRLVQNELVTKKQLAAVGELAAAIAHEVRNPLAVIVNAVAGLRRSAVREEDRTMLLGIVDEEAARLNRLVTDLLRFARPVSVKRSPVSLLELAHRSRSSAMMDGHQISVRMDETPELQTVWVDPSLFRLVFDNLVENACQAMRSGGTVQIVVHRGQLRGEPAVKIEISDSGQGMEAGVRERALDPFFTTRPSGTGLGLPIVHRIVEAHGGEIQLDSEEGRGTTVTLLLPLGPPSDEVPSPGLPTVVVREEGESA